MGPVVTGRTARYSGRTGIDSADCVDKSLKVLTDKTNRMPLRRSGRNVASPQPTLGCEQKPCIYKVGNTGGNQDLPPEERLALYTFEVDECDPRPKKSRHKRNVRRRKRTDMSDKMDAEYTPTINVKKHLRPATFMLVTRQKKHLSTDVTYHGKMVLENEETVPVSDSSQCQNKGLAEYDKVTLQKEDTDALTGSNQCHNKGVTHQEKVTPQKEDTVAVTGMSLRCLSPGVAYCDSQSHRKKATENKENIAIVDTISTCQVASVTHNEHRNCLTENKAIISATANVTVHHKKPGISKNLADDSELNFNVESEPGQASSSCRSSLLVSPIVQCFSQCVTMRQTGKSKHVHGIQSVEDFTIDNCFGFDEESDDDDDDNYIHFSPKVNVAPNMKPGMSVPFALSSTPNPKPSFTRPEIKLIRSVQGGSKTTTLLTGQPASQSTVASVSAPKLELSSDMTPLDTVDAANCPCPSISDTDDSVPVQHFMKPVRRSYERPFKSYQELHSEDSLSEDEARSKKRSKRTKKARDKEKKTLEKWAANVSAEFDEIDSFKLCVE